MMMNVYDWSKLGKGDAISVRGRGATVEDIDLPLLFWKYDGDDVVYHRSLKNDAEMFTIVAKETQSSFEVGSRIIASFEGQSKIGVISGPLTDGQYPILFEDEKNTISYQPMDAVHLFDPSASSETFPAAHEAIKGLTMAFNSRPKKTLFENMSNEIFECDVKLPGAVHMENCTDSKVTMLYKVSDITMVNCHRIEFVFPSVVSSLNMIKSTNCQLHCQDYCATYSLEHCSAVRINFYKQTQREEMINPVHCNTTECSEISLVAIAKKYSSVEQKDTFSSSSHQDNPDSLQVLDDTTDNNVSYIIERNDTTGSGDKIASSQTIYDNGVFSTSAQREGIC